MDINEIKLSFVIIIVSRKFKVLRGLRADEKI